jgi:2-hydroxychromene-2-carboxylate isomerase
LIDANEQENKNELKKRTNAAYQKGIFGLPSFVVNKKLFWGQDRLDFVFTELKKV